MSRLITAYQTSLAHTSPVKSYTLTAHGGGSLREFIYYQAETGILSFNWIEGPSAIRAMWPRSAPTAPAEFQVYFALGGWRMTLRETWRLVYIPGGAKAMLGRTRPCANECRM
ncbi:hypothetical protein PoMZ_09221 [Pyricularia oryzae]|uniref:Uncharacterized protein n=1 Tax=Pyricularia oryzae TaxID=318829 RepID=A0A4P7N170_PYROR|nr:hypothetical protein PoMZ_09221 [Pyricularia oryzae]